MDSEHCLDGAAHESHEWGNYTGPLSNDVVMHLCDGVELAQIPKHCPDEHLHEPHSWVAIVMSFSFDIDKVVNRGQECLCDGKALMLIDWV